MGSFAFENQALGAFLVYYPSGEEQLDQMALGMLVHNRIPGVLPVNCIQMDKRQIVRFQISSLTALMGYWAGAISRQKLLPFLSSFCHAVLEVQEYMLDPNQFLLNWDQIFVDSLTGEAYLAYLPVRQMPVQPTLEEFLRNLLQRTTFASGEDSSHIPVLLNLVNIPHFSIRKLYDQVQNLISGASAPVGRQLFEQASPTSIPQSAKKPQLVKCPAPPGQSSPAQAARIVRQLPPPSAQRLYHPPVQVPPLVNGAASQTISLEASVKQSDSGQAAGLRLLRCLTGECATIDKPVFHVGRERRIVDFCLTGGQNWVGTDHAYFLIKSDGVYIVDNNSLNHTWLNGEKLASNHPYMVRPGDKVKMADEEFELLSL